MAYKFKHIIFNPRVRLCLGIVVFLAAAGWIYSGRWQIWQNPDFPPHVENAQAVSWYNASWGYRKTLTIDYTKVSTTLSNFPVMVSTTDSNLTSYASSTGADILFTSSDGTTKLNHEIESYTSSTGKLIAWVQVPSLSNSADTVLYMYYGNTGAVDQQNVTSTWDSDYLGVWHLKENPSDPAPEFKDSTATGADGTSIGANAAVNAFINGGLYFEGQYDRVELPEAPFAVTGAITVSGWVNMLGNAGFHTNPRIFSKNNIVSPNRGWDLGSVSDKMRFAIFDDTASNTLFAALEQTQTAYNEWFYYVGVFNPSTAVILYKNGVQDAINTTSIPATQYNNASINPLFAERPGCSDCYWYGYLDEMRISDAVRSSGWILTEYNNQSSPSTFYDWGGAETPRTYNQSAYRLFDNDNSTSVGTALAAVNTSSSLASTGAAFRLRALIHIGGNQLDASEQSFKLQFATSSGECDTSFSGESYVDVSSATLIADKNNSTPADGDSLTASSTADPTHSGHTNVAQTYEEANNFTNSVAAVPAGQDGLWDFALYDNGATASTSYCLRIVKSDDSQLDTYTVIPEIKTAAGAATVVSVSISDGVVSYGYLSAGASTTTIALGDTQTATNDGTVTENFNIKGQDTACPWILAATTSTDQYVHQFSTNSGSSWTALTTSSYQSLATGIAVSGNQTFDLRIFVPTSTNCFTQQSVDVTIQAVQQ